MSDARQAGALGEVAEAVDGYLAGFLAARVDELASLDGLLEPVARAASELVTVGGKRLRPAFVHWGHVAAGADPSDAAAVLPVAAAVELLHAFALIHDDVMDRSDERRGRPAVHRLLAAEHTAAGLQGDAQWFGVGGAILAGDLVFVWADAAFEEAALPEDALARGRAVFTRLRTEVMAGQYLDLRLAGDPTAGARDAVRVALLKSGRYTVTRPLQLGAALATGGGAASVDAALQAYGDALGIAFQLRDDILGLFGDPARTGKGAVGDLREGKRTLLILEALERADDAGSAELLAALGNPALDEAGAERVRAVVRGCGALEQVERRLAEHLDRAQEAAASLPGPAADALAALAESAANRSA